MNDLKAVTGHNPRVWLLMRLALAFLFTTFATCPSAHAQYSSGVDGTAIDSSGAGVPNATITLTNIALGVTKTVTANEVGYFKIDSIASGTYRLEVSSP